MNVPELLRAIKQRITKVRGPQVAVVRLYGVIGSLGPLRSGLSLASLAGTLESAFSQRSLSAVALAINSPGGAAAQSALIAERIRQLASEKNLPVIAFVEDVAASGGYWLATAADEIYATETSIVGSIGVIAAGFGFHELIKRLGIRRRLYTAGERKSILDPFLAEDPDDVARLKALQSEVHEAFKAHVRGRRAGKLKGDEAALFTGEFWSGRHAVELGLIDGIGDLRGTLRQRFGTKVRLRVVGGGRSWLRRRLGLMSEGSPTFGLPADWVPELIAALEARALWSRFGL